MGTYKIENLVYNLKDKRHTKPSDDRIQFTVIGNRIRKEFIYCMHVVQKLHNYRQKQFKSPVIRGVTSVEWPSVWSDLKNIFASPAYCLKSEVAVLMDGKFLGGENELREFVESRYEFYLQIDYFKEGIQQFANYINSQSNPCTYLNIAINGEPVGTLIFMLYADKVPITCQNFLKMCKTTKGGYAGTPIHRIVKDGWIQCGGFNLKSDKELTCENFIIPHDRRGLLCMANDGRHKDCSTQFFVLLQPAPWMDHKYVAFGQLIEGEGTLRNIESVPTWYESPKAEITIYKTGILEMNSPAMPVNVQTKDYINAHIEDINTIGEVIYEAILEKLFNEIDHKLVKFKVTERPKHSLEGFGNNVRKAKSFMLKSEDELKHLLKSDDDASPSTSDGDVHLEDSNSDVSQSHYGHNSHYEQVVPVATRSTVVKPKNHLYLPLKEVPYPGEVDSNFELQRLLRGDYCLQSDLQKEPITRNEHYRIPDEVLCALFADYETSADEFEYLLRHDDEENIKNYIKANTDAVSFAGRQIKKIANINKKSEIFDDDKNKTMGTLTDEELRLIRVARKYNTAGFKKATLYLQSPRQSCTRDSDTKTNLLGGISNFMQFDKEDSGYDISSDLFKDPLLSSNDTKKPKTHIRVKEQNESSKGFSDKLYMQTHIDSEFQFTKNTRKHQPSITVSEYIKKNQLQKADDVQKIDSSRLQRFLGIDDFTALDDTDDMSLQDFEIV